MLNFLSTFGIMLSCIALFLHLFFLYAFFYSFIAFKKRKIKNWKFWKIQKKCVFMYTGTCVPSDGFWNKVSQFLISCSLDERLHAQLSNVGFVTLFKWFVWFSWSLIFRIINYSFWWEGLENSKRKA